MSSNANFPFGGPPPFGPPPPITTTNNNNAAPAATTAAESPSCIDSSTFADIDIIIFGIKEDVGALLSSIQAFARKRSDGESVGLSVALDVNHHLQGQRDLEGCVRFVRTHGRDMVEMAMGVFEEDSERWEEDEIEDGDGEGVLGAEGSGDGAGEEDVAGGQDVLANESELDAQGEDGEEFEASEEDITRIQWMEASEAMEVVRRLDALQDKLLRDIPLLSEEERAHRPTCAWTEMIGDDWYEVVEARLKGERFW